MTAGMATVNLFNSRMVRLLSRAVRTAATYNRDTGTAMANLGGPAQRVTIITRVFAVSGGSTVTDGAQESLDGNTGTGEIAGTVAGSARSAVGLYKLDIDENQGLVCPYLQANHVVAGAGNVEFDVWALLG